jgi:hypothetical protein
MLMVPTISLALVLSILASTGCEATLASNETSEDALVGGAEPATLPPGVVALAQGCTATKIGRREFLTAGHCVTHRQGSADFDPVTLEPNRKAVYPKGEPFCVFPTLRVPGFDDADAMLKACVVVTPVWVKAHPTWIAHANKGIPSLIPDRLDLSDVAVMRVAADTPTIPIAPSRRLRSTRISRYGWGGTDAKAIRRHLQTRLASTASGTAASRRSVRGRSSFHRGAPSRRASATPAAPRSRPRAASFAWSP